MLFHYSHIPSIMGDSFDISEFINNDSDVVAGSNELNDLVENIWCEDVGNPEILNHISGVPKEHVGGVVDVVSPPIGRAEMELPRDIDGRLTTGDMLTLIRSCVDQYGPAGHHIESLNTFYSTGIKQITCDVFQIEGRIKNIREETAEDRDISDISYLVKFTDVNLPLPLTTKYKSGSLEMQTPNLSRAKNLTYSSQLLLTMQASITAVHKNGTTETKTATVRDHMSGSIPVGVRTTQCHTHGCSREMLKELEEDPNGIGGEFIIKGSEWAIDNLENLTNNTYHVYKQQHLNEVVRGTFLSKPGDAFENSYYMVLRYLNNGAITVELVMGKNEKFVIPFYILFRALGMTSDRDIVNNIVYGIDNTDPITLRMMEILDRAFNVVDSKFEKIQNTVNSVDIINYIARKITDSSNNPNVSKDDNIMKYINLNVLTTFDRKFLPHIGNRPEHRIRKLRFLGHLINKLLRVDQGVLDSTDRDSYRNKRVMSAGNSLAKAYKTALNFTVVQSIKSRINKTLRGTSFSSINIADTITGAIGSDDLRRMLEQSITTGNEKIVIKRNEITNRISSQQVYHKNDLNVKSTLNVINTPNTSASKQNERADDMRRVHSTYQGYIDVSQSADSGEKIGMTKQKACMAIISGSSSSVTLKMKLLEDPDILPIDSVLPEQITAEKLAKVLVNGDWIGCCRKSHLLTSKYRNIRRNGEIHYQTTIVWEPLVREVYFWTDVGRLLRPIMIVYNNLEEYNAWWQGRPAEERNQHILRAKSAVSAKGTVSADSADSAKGTKASQIQFNQWILLRKEHIEGLQSGELTMDNLREQRIVEYVSPEEQENTLIAYNIDILREHAHDVTHMFTHCDIDQSIMGLVTLASPLANHSSTARITMYTNHRKQSAGWFALNWPFRIDKNTTLQYYGERPLVTCFSDSITLPNGQNCIVALSCYTGQGQEDSIILNGSSVDAGIFNASCFNNEKTKLEKNEQFGNPDMQHTKGVKKGANYEFTENGFVREGTIAQKNTVLIVKSAKIQKPEDQYLYEDRSVIYTYDEPVYIEKVITPRNDEDALIAKVKTRAVRPLGIGDKLCLTPDHDVLTARGWIPIAEVTLDDRVAILDPISMQTNYEYPLETHVFDHDDTVYTVKDENVNQCVTPDHRMFVSDYPDSDWKLQKASEIYNAHDTKYYHKTVDYREISPVWFRKKLPGVSINHEFKMPFQDWLVILGAYICCGEVVGSQVRFDVGKLDVSVNRVLKLENALSAAGLRSEFTAGTASSVDTCVDTCVVNSVQLSLCLGEIPKGRLPEWSMLMNKRMSKTLLNMFMNAEGIRAYPPRFAIMRGDAAMLHDVSRLALHAGYDCSTSEISASDASLRIYHAGERVSVQPHDCTASKYTGSVHCLTVRTGIFMVRREGVNSWTGNSSRSGNKGIVAHILNRIDMPFCDDGLIPDIIVNSHSIPTRMAINQIIECVMAQLAVARGSLIDATSFRKINIENMLEELDSYGIKNGGHRNASNGFTGIRMNAPLFIGPTTYQRLQKFVIDDHYSIRRGPTTQLMHQPLDGTSKGGGLRIGEMEQWVLTAHGAMRLLDEKFYKNSDGTNIYVCRICQNRAIVNIKEGIYKCKYCDDGADIGEVPSSWVANLFFNNAATMNIDMKFGLRPYEFMRNSGANH